MIFRSALPFSLPVFRPWSLSLWLLHAGIVDDFSISTCFVWCSAERSDEDQNFELELVLATIDTGDKPPKAPKEASTGGHASNQTSQDLSCRASDHGYDDSHGSVQVRRQRRGQAWS